MDSVEKREDALDQWNSSLVKYLIGNDILLWLYMCVGITGNVLVILVYIFKMKIKRDDRFFIPSLAVTDIIVCILSGSFSLTWNMLPVKFESEIACQTLWFCTQAVTITSGCILLIIAFHRYLKVCRPYVSFPQKWKYVSVMLSVVLSSAYSVPVFVYYGKVEIFNANLNITGYWCGQKRKDVPYIIVYDISVAVIAVLASITLIIVYILIGKQIYKKFLTFKKSIKQGKNEQSQSNSVNMDMLPSGKQDKDNTQSPKQKSNSIDYLVECETYRRKVKRGSEDILEQGRFLTIGQHFRTHRYSYMFMTITALFIIAYVPRITLMLIETFYPEFWERPSEEISGYLILYRLYILNHAVNPFIYAFFDTRFRKEVSEILRCCCSKNETTRL